MSNTVYSRLVHWWSAACEQGEWSLARLFINELDYRDGD